MARIRIDTKKTTLNIAFKSFIQDCRLRNLSHKTEEFYQLGLTKFSQQYPNIKLVNELNEQVYNQFVLDLRAQDIKPVTVAMYARSIRTFFNYLMRNEYIDSFKMTVFKAQKDIKETYTDEDLNKLLKKPTKKEMTHSFSQYRTWVIINYLMATGNRASTICGLKVADVDLSSGYVILRVMKNKKQQILPLTGTLIKILGEYIPLSGLSEDDYLFPSVYGGKLSVHALRQAIERFNASRGVTKSGTHLFRHTFAKKWIMGGGDIFSLQKMLNHSDIKILQEYVELLSEDVRASNEVYNPLEALSKLRQKKRIGV